MIGVVTLPPVRCVQMYADCPGCGRRCLWVGRAVNDCGTEWAIHCRRCVPSLGKVG